MPLSSFLTVRSVPQQQYAQLEMEAVVQEDGDTDKSKAEGDRAFLLSKGDENDHEEPVAMFCRTPQRFKALASPLWLVRDPLHGNMNLLIRRMDDTTFLLVVSRKATLSYLKDAIRDKFQADGCQISWPHVWGHFCLSFRNQKLLEEHIVLYKIGVRDLDELVFVRHIDTRPHKASWPGGFFSNFRRKHRLTI